MTGSIIAGIAGLGSAIASGAMSAKANKKAEREANALYGKEQSYHLNQMNRDPLSSFQNQALIGKLQRTLRERIDNARGRQKIVGGLDNTAMMKEQNAQSLAGLYQNILARNENRVQKAEANLLGSQIRQGQENINRDLVRKQNIAQSSSNVGNSIAGIAKGIDGLSDKDDTQATTAGTQGNENDDRDKYL